jgi:hypothetical protein
MAKELSKEERAEIVRRLHAELLARREKGPLTSEEMLSFAARMPGMPDGWSSAEYIREFRGALPEDDSDFPNDRR